MFDFEDLLFEVNDGLAGFARVHFGPFLGRLWNMRQLFRRPLGDEL